MVYGDLPDEEKEANRQNVTDIRLSGELRMTVVDLNLDEKAVGYSLNVSYNQELLRNMKISSYAQTIDYDSPNRWMYYGKVEHE